MSTFLVFIGLLIFTIFAPYFLAKAIYDNEDEPIFIIWIKGFISIALVSLLLILLVALAGAMTGQSCNC